MANLKTKYMGLDLKNPIIVGSSGLTDNVESIKELAAAGAGAIVLKSLFEEQIILDIAENMGDYNPTHGHTEAMDYQVFYETQHKVSQYLQLIRAAKAEVDIPIIGSVNCVTSSDWTTFAKQIEGAGADALELNIFILPSDPKVDPAAQRAIYDEIISKVTKIVNIPVAIKVSSYFDNVAGSLQKLSRSNVKGMVLFNRFYTPDIDIEKEELVVNNYFTTADDKANTLRWIGIMSGLVDCDLSASTGIHDAKDVIKMILVGASSVQMVSAIYEKSPQVITEVLAGIDTWMDKHNYSSIEDFKGKLSKLTSGNDALYERVQFMKYFGTKK